MKRFDNKDLIWVFNSKTKNCDVFYVEGEFFLSLSTRKYVDLKRINSNLTFLTSEALCNYIGVSYRSNEHYTELKILNLLNSLKKCIKNFKTNNLKIIINNENREICIATLDKSSKNPFVYNLITGQKIDGEIILDKLNKNWSLIPSKDLKIYSYDNAKEYILKNRKAFALPIVSTLNKNFLSYEEANKFLKAFEKTYVYMNKSVNKQRNLEM